MRKRDRKKHGMEKARDTQVPSIRKSELYTNITDISGKEDINSHRR